MIGYFPDPYPDEVFYSLCARFSERMQYPSKILAVSQDLFGTKHASINVDLPRRLDFFTAALPPGHSCRDLNHLIDHHTLWPFYRPFLPVERQQAALTAMTDVAGHRPDHPAGTSISHIPRPDWLRFCPECVAQDRRQFGECYWHRLHQVPGLDVCPTHALWLENSPVGVGWRRASYQFVPAEAILHPISARPLPLSHPWYEFLLHLSREAAWLLDQPDRGLHAAILKQRYKFLLTEQGLASYTQVLRTRTAQLRQRFSDFYPAELLAWLNCSLEDTTKAKWLNRLTHEGTHAPIQHPLRHLLLIHFLGHTAQTIFELPSIQQLPFGQGPWPCLNPVCPHYHQPVIETYRLEQRPLARPVATFSCECGFQYRRRGPDRSEADRFRGKRVAYGPLWEDELRRLWNEPSQSMARTARRLGVHEQTLQRQAGRLGLPFPAPGSRILPHSRRVPRPLARVDPCIPPGPADEYRTRWLEIRTDHPDLSRKQLRRTFRPLYEWLNRYDRDWLLSHLPPVKKAGCLPKPRTPSLDWHQRDVHLVHEVRTVAQHLLEQPGRPTRISKSVIARHIKPLKSSLNVLDRLPLTARLLAEVEETWEDTAIRRVWWAAELFQQAGIRPSRNQLLVRAEAGYQVRQKNSTLVSQTIDAALSKLNQDIYAP